jgi:hypothetical protein
MSLKIPLVLGTMGEEDFRVLIRITEENLTETPLLFVEKGRMQTEVKLSFRTLFFVNQINLNMIIVEEKVNKRS